jgi:pyruvate/2-oxoglutarate/acetoin dehydrogenase E1 component
MRNAETFAAAINRSLAGLLERHPETILLGEDIEDPFGGAFRVTPGLSTRFPGRVVNTPISEPSIVGVGSGLALAGMRPIVEIMFGDFVGLCADQIINHAAKFPWMYGHEVPLPLTIRTASGSGKNYGPTHSQSLEALFIGLPDFEIWSPFPLHDVPAVYERACLRPRAKLMVEAKALYPVRLPDSPYLTATLPANGGTLVFSNCRGERPDAVVLAYGRMAYEALELLETLFERELFVELMVPARIYPFDPSCLAQRIAEGSRLLVVEEGWEAKGWGRYLAGLCHDRWHRRLDRPVRCLGCADLPIGTAPEIEALALPNREKILDALREVCR